LFHILSNIKGSRCLFSALSLFWKANISYVFSVRMSVRVDKLFSCWNDSVKMLYFGILLNFFFKEIQVLK